MLKDEFDKLIDYLAGAIRNYYGERLVVLAVFGSAARGVLRPDSDVDIFICAKELPRGRRARIKEFESVEKLLSALLKDMRRAGISTRISPIIKTPEETEEGSILFIDMIEHVRIIFDKDGFFSKYLVELKNKMANLGSKKVKVGSAWFWDLVPDFKMIKEASL